MAPPFYYAAVISRSPLLGGVFFNLDARNLALSNGANVTSWTDGASGLVLTPSTGTPTYDSSTFTAPVVNLLTSAMRVDLGSGESNVLDQTEGANNAFTISIRVLFTAVAESKNIFSISDLIAGTVIRHRVRYAANETFFWQRSGESGNLVQVAATSSGLLANTWYTITCTVEPHSVAGQVLMTAYKDGAVFSSGTATGTSLISNQRYITIGEAVSGADDAKAYIGRITMWGRKLNATEIANIVASDALTWRHSPWTIPDTIAWLDYDDPTTTAGTTTFTSITDKSSNAFVFNTAVSSVPSLSTTCFQGHTSSRGGRQGSPSTGLASSNATLLNIVNTNTGGYTWAGYVRNDSFPQSICEIGLRLTSGTVLGSNINPTYRNQVSSAGTLLPTQLSFGNISSSINWVSSSTVKVPPADGQWRSWTITWSRTTGQITASINNGQYLLTGSIATGGGAKANFVSNVQRTTSSTMLAGLYNRVLTNAEISSIHTYMNNRFTPPSPWQLTSSIVWISYDDAVAGSGGNAGRIVSVTDRANGVVFNTASFGVFPLRDASTKPNHVVAAGSSSSGFAAALGVTSSLLNNLINSSTSGLTWATYGRIDNLTGDNLHLGPDLSGSIPLIPLVVSSSNVLQFLSESSIVTVPLSRPVADNVFHTWTFTWDRATGIFSASRDNGDFFTSSVQPSGLYVNEVINSRASITGSSVGVHALWGRVLSASELSFVHSYLSATYVQGNS